MSSDTSAITTLLQSYASALNDSSSSKVMALYTQDAIFMPQNFPTIEGYEKIQSTYEKIFATITLHVSMDVREVVVTTPEWAFARTTTEGTQKINESGATTKEGNQELFVCKKVDGEWKLARYCFCTTNPPK